MTARGFTPRPPTSRNKGVAMMPPPAMDSAVQRGGIRENRTMPWAVGMIHPMPLIAQAANTSGVGSGAGISHEATPTTAIGP